MSLDLKPTCSMNYSKALSSGISTDTKLVNQGVSQRSAIVPDTSSQLNEVTDSVKLFFHDFKPTEPIEPRSCLKVATIMPPSESAKSKHKAKFSLPVDFVEKNSRERYRSKTGLKAQAIATSFISKEDFTQSKTKTDTVASINDRQGRGNNTRSVLRQKVGNISTMSSTKTISVIIPTEHGPQTKKLLLRPDSKESSCHSHSAPNTPNTPSAPSAPSAPSSLKASHQNKRPSAPRRPLTSIKETHPPKVKTKTTRSTAYSLSQPKIFTQQQSKSITKPLTVIESLQTDEPTLLNTIEQDNILPDQQLQIDEILQTESKTDTETAQHLVQKLEPPIRSITVPPVLAETTSDKKNEEVGAAIIDAPLKVEPDRTKTTSVACQKKHKKPHVNSVILDYQPTLLTPPVTLIDSLKQNQEVIKKEENKKLLKAKLKNELKRISHKERNPQSVDSDPLAICQSDISDPDEFYKVIQHFSKTTIKTRTLEPRSIKHCLFMLNTHYSTFLLHVKPIMNGTRESYRRLSPAGKQNKLLSIFKIINKMFNLYFTLAQEVDNYLIEDEKLDKYLFTCFGRCLYCMSIAEELIPTLSNQAKRKIKNEGECLVWSEDELKLSALKTGISNRLLYSSCKKSKQLHSSPSDFIDTTFADDRQTSLDIYKQVVPACLASTQSVKSNIFPSKVEYWVSRLVLVSQTHEFSEFPQITAHILTSMNELAGSKIRLGIIQTFLTLRLNFYRVIDETSQSVQASFTLNGFDQLELDKVELLQNFEMVEEKDQHHKKLVEMFVVLGNERSAKDKAMKMYLDIASKVCRLNNALTIGYSEKIEQQKKQFEFKLSVCQKVAQELLVEEDLLVTQQLERSFSHPPRDDIELAASSESESDTDSINSEVFFDCRTDVVAIKTINTTGNPPREPIQQIGIDLARATNKRKLEIAEKSYPILAEALKEVSIPAQKKFEIVVIMIDCDFVLLRSIISKVTVNHMNVLQYHHALMSDPDKAQTLDGTFKNAVSNITEQIPLLDERINSLIILLEQLNYAAEQEHNSREQLECVEFLNQNISTLLASLAKLSSIKIDVSESYFQRGVRIRERFSSRPQDSRTQNKSGPDLKDNVRKLMSTTNLFDRYVTQITELTGQIKEQVKLSYRPIDKTH